MQYIKHTYAVVATKYTAIAQYAADNFKPS
jgi:hypothetical protein